MTNSTPIDPSEFLLAQFDAICAFEAGVREKRVGIPPHTLKTWYFQGQIQVIQNYPWALTLCQELEKVVPLDHRYWDSMLGA